MLPALLLAAVTIDPSGVIRINGRPVFPIGFTKAPPAGGKTPSGKSAYAELAANGTVFHRAGLENLDVVLDESARNGLFVAVTMPGLQSPAEGEVEKLSALRRNVLKYRDHPALFVWKAEDEPEWGKVPVERTRRFYDIVHALDRRHPVWMTQAPRGTIDSLKAYDPAYDIAAIDIYPVGYPPGAHSHLPNKHVSVVGDYAKWLREITRGRKPFWMVLQICWSGVARPGKTLRFPTFAEERYMTYQSIANGARGLLYFGGDVPGCLNERDAALGWNWTFYERVLKPVLDELRAIQPALLAPDVALPIRAEGSGGIEFCARQAGGSLYLIACKREGDTVQVKFTGLPPGAGEGRVLFEEPRKVTASSGAFTDWFGPNEVHVYRFELTGR